MNKGRMTDINIHFRDAVCLKKGTINPNSFPKEEFDYYSIPSYDISAGSERTLGKKIMSNKFLLESDCVLISKLNPRIPRICLAKINDNKRAICSTEFIPLMVRDEKTDLEYLSHYLFSSAFQKRFQAISGGSTNSHSRVTPLEILNIDFYRPPLLEQKKIAEILSGVDQVISKYVLKLNKEYLIAESIIESIEESCLSYKVPKVKIGDISTKVGSGITPRGGSDIYLKRGVKLIRSQNVLKMKLSLSNVAHIPSSIHKQMHNSSIKKGDILLNITGASIGR